VQIEYASEPGSTGDFHWEGGARSSTAFTIELVDGHQAPVLDVVPEYPCDGQPFLVQDGVPFVVAMSWDNSEAGDSIILRTQPAPLPPGFSLFVYAEQLFGGELDSRGGADFVFEPRQEQVGQPFAITLSVTNSLTHLTSFRTLHFGVVNMLADAPPCLPGESALGVQPSSGVLWPTGGERGAACTEPCIAALLASGITCKACTWELTKAFGPFC